MNNRLEIFHRLDLPPKGILIQAIEITDWGNTIRLHCQYDPDNLQLFDLLFSGCEKFSIECFHDITAQDDKADVIGITLGQGNLKQPAIIHTDIFEIIIHYKSLATIKNK